MKKIILVSLLIGFFGSCSQEPQTLEELKKAGEKAFINEDYAAARKYLSKAVAQRPSDRHLLYLLGISYQRDYLYDSAFFYLKRVDVLFPGDREVNLELYKIAEAIEDWKNAIKAIHVLVKTGDPIEQYYSALAELNLKNENFKAAYYFYRKLLETQPDNPNHHLVVANLAAQLDSLDVSLAVTDSALEKFGPKVEFLLNKGMFLTAKRRYQESEAIFRSLLASDSSSVPYKLNLANVLASQDDRGKKQEAYRLYLDLKPVVGGEFRLDSMISALEKELNIEK